MDTAPDNPLAVVGTWLDEASTRSTRRNPLAMSLATADSSGAPSVRLVLLKQFSVEHGYLVFYTNYRSRKGLELAENPRAAAAMYWEEFGGRQLRVEGPIVKSPTAESDGYFAGRPAGSQINAWVSEQSEPISDYEALQRRMLAKADALGVPAAALDGERPHAAVPRPRFWGGYRLWFDAVELWLEGRGRFHRRFRYLRNLEPLDESGFTAGPWRMEYLQP